jgi:hypothetical protein
MYSSASDLSTFGRAILSSKLIKPSLTRRWLNPVTFSSDFLASIGAPWGIRRIQLAKETQPHRTISVYTKAGTFRKYTAFITLLKEFNLGFTIMMAGTPALNNFFGADLIGASLIPAYDAVARDEADKKYSGVYVAQPLFVNGTAGNSSSLTISTDANKPGLDYTQLDAKTSNGGMRQSWKAIFEITSGAAAGQQLWSTDCGAWVGVTGVTYGSLPLDEFIFNIDSTGKVVSVDNLALRLTYYKV